MIIDRLIVSTAAVSFPVVPNGVDQTVVLTGAPLDFVTVDGQRVFAPGEPTIIKKVRPLFPQQFGWGNDVVHFIGLRYRTILPTPAIVLIPAFGPTSTLRLNDLCENVELDIYVPAPDLVNSWCFALAFVHCNVSMLGVPDSLAGTANASYALDVQHTLPLNGL